MFLNIKKIVSLFVVIFILLWDISIFAVSPKWESLRNFKKQEYKLFFESDKPFLDEEAREIFDSLRKYELYKWIREKVQVKREFLQNENIKVTNKIWNLSDSVKTLDKEIKNIKLETIKINTQISFLIKTINIKTKTINILKDKINKNKDIFYEYIVHIYKKWNFIFTNWKIDNLKAILFSWEDMASIMNDINFKWIIQIAWRRLIDRHKWYINNLYIEQISLKKSEIESKKLRKQLLIQKWLISQKKEFKEKLLKISKWKQQIYQNFIADKVEDEKKIKNKEFIARLAFIRNKKELLKKEWCYFVDFSKIDPKQINLSEKCRALNWVIYIESQLKWFNKDDAWNIFEWPIEPKRWISTFFSDSWYINLFWEDHDALDIRATQWTDIKAPADGYVIHVTKPTSKWYSFLALKHSNWIITVYGHLSKILVKEMDIVRKWEIFAQTWWAPWTKWAWFLTTWPHLHFEVWEDKKFADPMEYLNISNLNSKDLPSMYFEKFKLDYKVRTWNEYKWVLKSNIKNRTFKIIGNTEIERQKNFLKNYATWPFKNWWLWVQEWMSWKIDPTFLMCVWLAESWLWKNLKTPFNVWNVWNTDSWATKYFSSASQWVRAMTQTFNNRYLWSYNEIKLLSRYWNPDKPIYASSPDNWHNNIISCMTFIKWRYVPDNYNFRLK